MTRIKERRIGDDEMEPIAVIGFAARLPQGADSADGFWRMLCEGRSAATQIPPKRFNIDAFYHPDADRSDTTNIKIGNFVKGDIAAFDAPFFGIQPTEVASMDPQQRLLLEASYHALENAGISMQSVVKSKTCVYVGSSARDYEALLLRDPECPPKYLGTGIGSALLANRISWFYDLKGPSVALDTACSSSLSALHLACQDLRSHGSRMGLVGGANLILAPDVSLVHLSSMGFFSPKGQCYSFDERANGYAKGEGAGMIVIKLLKYALEDGDTIRAVIRASGANQDGRTPGITQPSRVAQEENIKATYVAGGLDLDVTQYFEAHGTGTQVGDPIEAGAIASAFQRTRDNPLLVGALKPNIGHLESASGIAGLMKAVLVLENGLIPPNICFEKPNKNIHTEEWHIKFPTKPTPWPTKGLRRASVNSFGYGGSNVHIVLDDALNYLQTRGIEGKHCTARLPSGNRHHPLGWTAPRDPSRKTDGLTNGHTPHSTFQRPRIFILSAADEDGIRRQVDVYQAYLAKLFHATEEEAQDFLESLSNTLSKKRSSLPWKSYTIASSLKTLQQSLSAQMSKPVRSSTIPSISFVFTGQGAQWAGMGCNLMLFPVFHASLQESEQILKALGSGWAMIQKMRESKESSAINDPELAQPLCTALQIALVDLFNSWNISPQAIIGHSSGEIGVAYCSGSLSQESALKVAYHRGRLAGQLEKRRMDIGRMAMASVALSEDAIAPYLGRASDRRQQGGITIGCINSPNNVTVTGEEQRIEALIKTMSDKGTFARKLRVSVAYHSPYMEDVVSEYRASIRDITQRSICTKSTCFEGSPAVFSSITGKRIAADQMSNPDYWIKNLVAQVRFKDALENMSGHLQQRKASRKGGQDLLVEIGPTAALQRPVKETLGQLPASDSIQYDAILKVDTPSLESCLGFIGRLCTRGYPINLSPINCPSTRESELRLLVDLPHYPFNHSQSYWVESRISKNFRMRKHARHELLGAPAADWNPLEPKWRNIIRATENPWIVDHKLGGSELYPAAGLMVMALEAIRQLADSRWLITGYRLEHVSFNKALLLSMTGEGTEAQLHFTRRKAGTISTFESDEFTIYAYMNDEWSAICEGTVTMEHELAETGTDSSQFLQDEHEDICKNFDSSVKRCGDAIASKQFYKNLTSYGFGFGPTFQPLQNIRFNDRGEAAATIELDGWKDIEANADVRDHVIHPTALDGLGQLTMAAVSKGSWDAIPTMVPTQFKSVWISNDLLTRGSKDTLDVFAKATFQGYREADFSIAAVDAKRKAQIVIEGWRETAFSSQPSLGETALRCYHIEWQPDHEQINGVGLAAPHKDEGALTASTEDASKTIIVVSEKPSLQADIVSELVVGLNATGSKGTEVLKMHDVGSKDLKGTVCIVLIEYDEPFLSNMSKEDFAALKEMRLCAHGILWVTQGCGERAPRPDLGLVTGFGRNTTSESTDTKFVEVALELGSSTTHQVKQIVTAFRRSRILSRDTAESEYMEKDGSLYRSRVVPAHGISKTIAARITKQAPAMQRFEAEPRLALKLTIESPGLLDTLRFLDDPQVEKPLAADEVEIKVHAAGMNFKDVIIALGKLPGSALGFECAGVVTRVGANTSFQPGQRVCCCSTTGTYSTYVRAHATSVASIPDHMSFCTAAALPLVFCTAHYSLVKLAQLQKGETILIHSGAGGVGQAAIQLAKYLGAEIFTTVGNEEKKQFLMNRYQIRGDHIFSSRDTSFAQGLKQMIGGVDVVLNSLSGDLLSASWSCIAPFGRFIELGKADINSREGLSMTPFAQNVTFASVDLSLVMDKAKPIMQSTLTAVMSLLTSDPPKLEAPPLHVYRVSEIEKAFRFMQSGKNIGKTVVEMHEDDLVPVVPSTKPTYSFAPDATYIIAGGLGGIGRSITRWMVNRGARNLVLLSRSGASSKEAQELLDEMKEQGANIWTPACDITNSSEVTSICHQISASMPPIKGCIQASMVLKDVLFENTTLADFETNTKAKVRGTWNLHTHLPPDLDFFLLLSSLSGVTGSRAQSSYAAANTYQNALARHRVSRGQKCISLDLGPILSTGVVAERGLSESLEAVGFKTIGKRELFGLLEYCCDPALPLPDSPWKSEIITGVDGAELLPPDRLEEIYWTRKPLFSILRQSARSANAASSNPSTTKADYANLLKQASTQSEAETIVTEALKSKLSKDLGIPVLDIDIEKPIHAFGIDSLVALEVRYWFMKEMTAEVTIFDIMQAQSLSALGGFAAGKSEYCGKVGEGEGGE